ncbi:MAG TPA: flavodoxin domain-containing protein [Burkholderiales bacterium]|nr:flavodoxin domain-containing protein [Burkholderiales bacterium]
MALDLTILVGTQTGVAQLVAQEIELRLDGGDIRPGTLLMDDADISVFAGGGLFLVCTSTYGQGDVPDGAKPFYDELMRARPDLSSVRYGLIGLGDRGTHGATFCFAAKKFDKLLGELGATRIGEPLFNDSNANLPEDEAAEWVGEWIELARAELAQTAR